MLFNLYSIKHSIKSLYGCCFVNVFCYLSILCFFISPSINAQNCATNAGVLDEIICAYDQMTLEGNSPTPIIGLPQWEQISGPTVTIVSPNSPTTDVTGYVGGQVYEFRYSATCGDGIYTFQDKRVTVQPITIAQAGSDFAVCPDTDGNVSVAGNIPLNPGEVGQWQIISDDTGLVIDFPNSQYTTLTLPPTACGVSTIAWVIKGPEYAIGQYCESSSQIQITNYGGVQPVIADEVRGQMATINKGNCYTVSQSHRLEATYGGCTSTQIGTWSFVSGPSTPVFSDINDNKATISELYEGTYVIRWTVQGACSIGSDDLTIVVPPPTQDVSSAGGGRVDYDLCDVVTTIVLEGPEPSFAGEVGEWIQSSGPSGAVIESPNNNNTLVTGLSGSFGDTYWFEYRILNNNTGCESARDYRVRYTGTPNIIIANGGEDLYGTCNQSQFEIPISTTGSGVNRYKILSGPDDSPLAPFPTSMKVLPNPLSINLEQEGVYTFAFYKTQGGDLPLGCADGSDSMRVYVAGVSTSANAGTDLGLACGVTDTPLSGNPPEDGNIPYWSQISGPSIATIADQYTHLTTATGLVSGAYEFQYQITGGLGCPITIDHVTMYVNSAALSTSSAGIPQSVCYGVPVTLGANIPPLDQKGTWSYVSGAPSDTITFSDINDPNAVATGFNTPNTTYQLEWKIEYVNPGPGCLTESASIVEIQTGPDSNPTLADAGPDQCLSPSPLQATLAANPPQGSETGVWTADPSTGVVFADPTDPNTTVTVPAVSIYTFTWTISPDPSSTCVATVDDMQVSFTGELTANAGPDQAAVCGQSTAMAAVKTSSASTGTWSYVSGPGGFIIADVNSPTTAIDFDASGTYVFEWTEQASPCSEVSAQVTLEIGIPVTVTTVISPSPDPSTGVYAMCGNSLSLQGSVFNPNTEVASWTLLSGAPNSPNFSSQTTNNINVSNLVTGDYTFRYEVAKKDNTHCSSDYDEITVRVLAQADAGSDVQMCANSATIFLEGTEGSVGTWSCISLNCPSPLDMTVVNDYSAVVTLPYDDATDYEFEYTIAGSGACLTSSDTKKITINGIPAPDPDAGVDQLICIPDSGTTATLGALNTPSIGTSQWKLAYAPDGATPNIDSPSDPNSTVSGMTQPGIYIFEWTFSNSNCIQLADVVRIEMYDAPGGPIDAGADNPDACQLSYATDAQVPSSGVGVWSFVIDPSGGTTVIDNPNSAVTTLSNVVPGTYELEWAVSTINATFAPPSACATVTDTVTVTFLDEVPSLANAGLDQEFCDQTVTNLAATPVTSGEGTWSLVSGPNTPTITAINNPNALVFGLQEGSYEFMWTTSMIGGSNADCTFTDTVKVDIYNTPSVADAGADQVIPEFQILNMNATPPSIGSGKWTLLSGPTTSVSFADDTGPLTTVSGLAVGTYEFAWEVSNGICSSSVDTMLVQIKANADLELDKSVAPTMANIGDVVTFTIEVYNDNINPNNRDATAVEVQDILPSGFELVSGSVSNSGSYDLATKTLTWSGLSIANGGTQTLIYQATVLDGTSYDNQAQVTASDQYDDDSNYSTLSTGFVDDDEDVASITIASSDLSLEKQVSQPKVSVGDAITFILVVTNDGPDQATNVVVLDKLPQGYAYLSDNTSGNYDPSTGLWTVGTIDVGVPQSIEITVSVNPSTSTVDEYTNVAEIYSVDQRDPDSESNNDDGDQSEDDESQASVTLENADLELTKQIDNTSGNIGDTLTFTVTVENVSSATSTGDATGVVIEDILPNGYSLVSGSISNSGLYDSGTSKITWSNISILNGTSVNLTYQVIVNATGSYVNTAEITASDLLDPDSTPANTDTTEDDIGTASFTVDTIELSLDKRTNPVLTEVQVGQTVTFEIEVSNATGHADATGVSIEDILPLGYSIKPSTISDAGILSFDGKFIVWNNLSVPSGSSYVLTYDTEVNEPQGIINEYKNIAQVTGSDQKDSVSDPNNDDGDQSEQDEIAFTLPIPEVVDLSVSITPDNPTPNVGDMVTFTVVIDNEGVDDASGVDLSSLIPLGYSNVSNPSMGGVVNGSGDGIDWSGLSVVSGGSTTLTFTAVVEEPTGGDDEYLVISEITATDQYDIDSNPSTPSGVDDNGDNLDDDDETSVGIVIQESDLSLVKSVSDTTPNAGDTVTFSLSVVNAGPDVATNVEITDVVPNGYSGIGSISNGGVVTGNSIVWSGLSVAANNGEEILTYTAVVEEPFAGVDYTNVASITGSDQYDPDSDPSQDASIDDKGDGELDDDEALVVSQVNQADLSLTKIVVDGDTSPLVGQEITFEVRVFNDGPQDATGVQVMDLLPIGYDFILYSSSAGTYNENTGVWTVGDLESQGSANLLIDALVRTPTGISNEYTNVAQVIASDVFDIDSRPNNDDGDQSEDDEDTAVVTPILPSADLAITKEVVDGDTSPLIGQEVTFKVTVVNNGPNDTTGVVVEDILPSGYDFLTFSSSTGAYDEVSGLWNVGNMANGDIETLLIDVAVNPQGDYLNITELVASDLPDLDSTPDNGIETEDDYDQALTTPIYNIASFYKQNNCRWY